MLAGAALVLAASATTIPAAPPDTAAAQPPPAVFRPPAGFTFEVPPTTPAAREKRPASRTQRATRRPAHRHAGKPLTKRKPKLERAAARRAIPDRARTVHRVVRRAVPAGRGLAAVAGFAYRQVGDRYVHGAAGPDAWDCSGLTAGAYARIGVRLPHRAAAQARRGQRVSRSAARPGDLVVWPGHVGIYIGAGRVVHAPGSGRRVKTARVWGAPTFRRIG